MASWRGRLLVGAGLGFVMTVSVLTAPQPMTGTKATVESPIQLSVIAGPKLAVEVWPSENNAHLMILWESIGDSRDRGELNVQFVESDKRRLVTADLTGLSAGDYEAVAVLFVIERDGIRGRLAAPYYSRVSFSHWNGH